MMKFWSFGFELSQKKIRKWKPCDKLNSAKSLVYEKEVLAVHIVNNILFIIIKNEYITVNIYELENTSVLIHSRRIFPFTKAAIAFDFPMVYFVGGEDDDTKIIFK